RADEARAAGFPVLLEDRLDLGIGELGGGRGSRSLLAGHGFETAEPGDLAEPGEPAVLAVVALELLDEVRRERAVARRHAEVRRALEHGEVAGVLGDDRDRLDRRRAGADDADALAVERHRMMRPQARLVELAAEVAEAGNVR